VLFHEAVFHSQHFKGKNTLYDLQNEFQESEGMHMNVKFSVPYVHVPAAEDDVSQELQFFSGAEADV
jgi:hypothetical protein